MRRALIWYENQITEKFQGRLMSPSMEYEVVANLEHLQALQQRRENNPIWTVPVNVVFNRQTNQMGVVVTDENQVLYYDFDQP